MPTKNPIPTELQDNELYQYMLDQCAKHARPYVCTELYKLILADDEREIEPREAARQAMRIASGFPFDAMRREKVLAR